MGELKRGREIMRVFDAEARVQAAAPSDLSSRGG